MKKLLVLVALMSTNAFANSVREGQFKLYPEAGFVPNPGCDIHTSIVLDNGNLLGPVAVVENGLGGFCEIYVHPDTKLFRLVQSDAGCGSKQYEGEFRGQSGDYNLQIVDHRARICRDIVPARLIVTIEEQNSGVKTTLYSSNSK